MEQSYSKGLKGGSEMTKGCFTASQARREWDPRYSAGRRDVDVGCVLVFILRGHSLSSDIESELKKREANKS